MTRFFDKVGFAATGTLIDGVWSDNMTERDYYGDVLEITKSIEESDKVKDDYRLQNRISIMADDFALENFSAIKYVSWGGVRWTVNTVTVERPRILLSLGGVYDDQIP